MLRSLILYESKYGSTKEAAQILGRILGPAAVCRPHEFMPVYKNFDLFVIGFPVYSGHLDPNLLEFIQENREWLSRKKLVLFSLSLDTLEGEELLKRLKEIIGGSLLTKKALGGRMFVDELLFEDKQTLKTFTKAVGLPLRDMNLFNTEKIVDFGLKIKELRDDLEPSGPSDSLRNSIISFLKTHNTCALATGHQNLVRTTPLEYNYHKGALFIITEGGEKLAHLTLNNNVSVAIYEDYNGMDKLAGMQITGEARIITEPEEYWEAVKIRGLNRELIDSIPVDMHILRIDIHKVEFIYSPFRDEGQAVKQIFNW